MPGSPLPHQPVTRLVDGRICAYDLTAGTTGVLSPAATCSPVPGDEVVEHAVAADLRHAFYTTLNAVVCATPDGTEVWRSRLEPESTVRHGHRPGCVLSPDGRAVWVYRPDAMAGRNRPDRWVALDAASGAVLAQADLDTVGHGGIQLAHRTSGEVLLDVGEGQDGSIVYRASLGEAGMELVRYPWDDRCLIDLSPDGGRFMTVGHNQADVTVHAYPGGEAVFTLRADAFGHDPEEDYLEWCGGFLSPDTVIATVFGETADGEEWFRHYRVDAHSGRVGAEFHSPGEAAYDLHPLGDGSWLTTDPSGHPVRWTSS